MPRRKLSEYKAKTIIHDWLTLPYVGWEGTAKSSLYKDVQGFSSYVIKVDQAVKGRFKRGLVALDLSKTELAKKIKEYTAQGFDHFIVEPYIVHRTGDERYISLSQERSGLYLRYSKQGGVDVESNLESIMRIRVDDTTKWEELSNETQLSTARLKSLVEAFKKNFFTFLEINPYVIEEGQLKILDLAVEVDDAGENFISGWSSDDIREPKHTVYPEEATVRALDKGSVASFSLSVINPEGSIFLLLSGGGASVVVADEIYNRGFGKQLANYGEYSGAPLAHEARKYTDEVLKLLTASSAPKKVLFIGGAVANFTDIATTFSGVIEALEGRAKQLAKQDVTVYVRRGGPRQEIGLENMRRALEGLGILGGVYDPDTSITDALSEALKGLKK